MHDSTQSGTHLTWYAGMVIRVEKEGMNMAQNTLIMMCGLPGSGKSYYAAQLAKETGFPVFSSDEIRKELTGSADNRERDEEVFGLLRTRVKASLGKGAGAIYDAGNSNAKRRAAFVKELTHCSCRKVCCFVHTPYSICLVNNENRPHHVPEEVIRSRYLSFHIPHTFEGWDEVRIIRNYPQPQPDLWELFYGKKGMIYLSHDNPHHTQTIGNHCISCMLNILSDGEPYDRRVVTAALLHDIGKPIVKDFVDSKGNPSEKAHYYQHHLVGAYEAVPYLDMFSASDRLDILAYITYHMQPYAWEKEHNEALRKKYECFWGEELYRQIMRLHAADLKAH